MTDEGEKVDRLSRGAAAADGEVEARAADEDEAVATVAAAAGGVATADAGGTSALIASICRRIFFAICCSACPAAARVDQ